MPAQTAAPATGAQRTRAQEVFAILAARYPSPAPALDYADAWGLLVATVLAAQCTDARVNQVTPTLFARWPRIADLADADVTDIEDVVRSTGFFRNKAKNLKAAAARVMAVYGGEVPRSMAELITLPGVARKTANIVLSNAFGINEGIAVDTHVTRLAFRLGFTQSDAPKIIERDLMPLFDRSQWADINHYLVFFGREVCDARKPKCAPENGPPCPLAHLCPRKGLK
ncbi:DNA-(apurinic or apyrimidinic site) lyase /endonuclease III [Humidesulfovibrio mexicanus]|uniref:Endonuclease III n=1 Tax=Humidesulfovibrio mexicanus TaxID=147047 RepID=A0A239D4N0_9BACT|nr:endonuclease III [Humidesulfovibrio mexicanus]SNS27375.1 DNA-(apurinic or apyrimidinic site) lyase /endonuclease III [Humidesulfovibrio mexicanus]